jgi:hypothetical protein
MKLLTPKNVLIIAAIAVVVPILVYKIFPTLKTKLAAI